MIKRIGREGKADYSGGEPTGRKAISSKLPVILEIAG
jgi:hypothetical protein